MGCNVLTARITTASKVLFLVAAICGVLPFLSSPVAAWDRVSAWNSIETQRKALCNDPTQTATVYGAVWINDTNYLSTGMDRWDEGITVAYDQTWVDVTMWTTAFACSNSNYVNNARVQNLNGLSGSPIPVNFISGTSIYRGDANPGHWTDRSQTTAGEQIGVLRIRLTIGSRATGCYNDAVQFTGQYVDADGAGYYSFYRQDLCIRRLPPPWTAGARTTVNNVASTTAYPGTVVTYRHYIDNNGPGTASISGGAYRTSPAASTVTTWGASSYASGQEKLLNTNNFTIPTSALSNTQYCQRTGWSPISSTTSGTGYSTPACVRVVYNYDLDPSVLSVPATTMVGQPITFTYSVQNTGTRTNTTNMGIRRIIIPPGGTFPAGFGEHGPGASCATYTGGAPAATCTTFGLPSTVFNAGETRTVYTEAGVTTTGLAPGTRVCRALSVDSRDENPAPNNRDSEVICTVISKAPYLSIINSDASAGGSTASPYTGTAGFTGYNTFGSGFGSFGEYGLIATGSITDFATAGRLVPSRDLMFANTPIGTSGQFQTTHRITDYVSRLAARGNAGTVAGNALNLGGGSRDYKEPAAGDITLTASNPLAADRKYLIYAPGRDVIISSDIIYTPTVNSFENAPSVIIVANNIRINANVSRVVAVLFAVNALSTCSQAGQTPAGLPVPATPISVGGACDGTQLKINGAAIARQVYTPRVSGGVTAADLPAEIFSLRPEAFLEPYESNQTSLMLRTDNETELPPRN